MPLTDAFRKQDTNDDEFLSNITIYRCYDCNTVQTQHDVDVADYYEDYQYSVGESKGASRFMQLLSDKILSTYFTKDNKSSIKVLEVGSGDGGQLEPFLTIGCQVLGYEPSSTLCRIAKEKGIDSIQGLFTERSPELLPDDFKNPDIILLSYTFDHLPDPVTFLKTVEKILNKEKGILAIEIHDLDKIFERSEFCLFEHEHSIYLNKFTATQLLNKLGFSIITFDILPDSEKRANSLLFIATPKGSRYSTESMQPEIPSERYYSEGVYQIKRSIKNLENFVKNFATENRKLAGYGAGGRGVMTLAAMNNAHKLTALIDRKPKGSNIIAPKSHVPVFGIEWLVNYRVDYILVFSFGYMKEIIEELSEHGYKSDQFYSLVDILKGDFKSVYE